jgi:hypothetical protein
MTDASLKSKSELYDVFVDGESGGWMLCVPSTSPFVTRHDHWRC